MCATVSWGAHESFMHPIFILKNGCDMRWLFCKTTTSFSLPSLFPPHQQKSYVALHEMEYKTKMSDPLDLPFQ
jgi:hypothetical protein